MFSEFEIKINWLEVQRKAFDKTKEYFNQFVTKPGYSIKYEDCPESSGETSYYRVKKDALLKTFRDEANKFGHEYKMKYAKLQRDIDIFLKKMRVSKYQEETSDAREFLS